MPSASEISHEQHSRLPGELADLGLDPVAAYAEIDATVGQAAAAYEGDTDPALDDRAAWLALAARQTALFKHLDAAAEAVNQRRKITMSVLFDEELHGFVASTLARLITIFTPPDEMAEVRAKAAAKGKGLDPDSAFAVTPTRVQQMVAEGRRMRGKRPNSRDRNRGRRPEPAERRLANAYQQLAALKATDPGRYDRIIAALGDATGPKEEASP